MEIHIGSLIKKRVEEVGMTKREFGRRINKSPQNVYDIFQRKSLDTDLLQLICETLNYDFFRLFSFSCQEEIKRLEGENNMLKEMNAIYKKQNGNN